MKRMCKLKKKVLAVVLSAGLTLTSAIPAGMQVFASEAAEEEITIAESTQDAEKSTEVNMDVSMDTSENRAEEKSAQEAQTETESKEVSKTADTEYQEKEKETVKETAVEEAESKTEEKASEAAKPDSTAEDKESAATEAESKAEEKTSTAAETEEQTGENNSKSEEAESETGEKGTTGMEAESSTQEQESGAEETSTEETSIDETSGTEEAAIEETVTGETELEDDEKDLKYSTETTGTGWEIKDGVLKITSQAGISTNKEWKYNSELRDAYTSVIVNCSIADADLSNLFYGCSGLTSVTFDKDRYGISLSGITSAKNMFPSSLTKVEFKGSVSFASGADISSMFSGCWNLKYLDLSTFDTSNVTNMSSMFSGCSNLGSSNDTYSTKIKFGSNFKTDNVKDMSSMFSGCSNLESLDLSRFNTKGVNNMSSMFFECGKLTEITFGANFKTSEVENMSSMFSGCSSLDKLDLGNFNTEKVTTMASMFSDCRELNSLNLSKFNTKNKSVSSIDMSSMFSGCKALLSIKYQDSYNSNNDIGLIWGKDFSTSRADKMNKMFSGSGFQTLNLSQLDTTEAKDMTEMFSSCTDLEEIQFGENFNADKVTSMEGMFSGCNNENFTKVDMSGVSVKDLESMKSMFSGCTNLTNVIFGEKFAASGVTDMTFMFENCKKLSDLTFMDSLNTTDPVNMTSMFSGCTALTDLEFGKDFQNNYLGNVSSMFRGCTGLTHVIFAENFAANTLTNMTTMFSGCTGLESVTFAGDFLAGALTSMRSMFANCTKLQDVSFAGTFEASGLMDMSLMFSGCAELKNVTFAGAFHADNLTNMSSMFLNCKLLETVSFINGIEAPKLQLVNAMFSGCSSLASMDFVNHFVSENLQNMNAMFLGCTALTEAKFDDDFNTSNVTDMSAMFSGCTALASVDIASFDTGHVMNMGSMFKDCSSLTELDLSTFSTDSVNSMAAILSGCTALETVNLSNFNTTSLTNINAMFKNCAKLYSIDLSSFDASQIVDPNAYNHGYVEDLFLGCDSLEMIQTPYNLRSPSAELPGGARWWRFNGDAPESHLPTNYKSIVLTRDKPPVGEEPQLLLNLEKTIFECGKPLDEAEIKANIIVTYNDVMGNGTIIDNYKMNLDNLDSSVLGTQELVVTYRGLEAKAEIRFVYLMNEQTLTIVMPSDKLIYNGEPKEIYPKVLAGENTLKLEQDYTVLFENNTNVGTAKVTIEGINNYGGTITKEFEIFKGVLEESAYQEDFKTQVDKVGSCNRPHREQTLDISGHFKDFADKTYEIVSYTEHKDNLENVLDGVPVLEGGTLIYNTNAGTAGDSAEITIRVSFANYEDVQFKVIVELTADVEEEDEIIEDAKMYISKIANQTYNGSGVKPNVYVYTYIEGKGVYLKEGTDYTIRYENNVESDSVTNIGGTSSTGEEGDKGFTKKLPYIIISGKGNYSGTLYKNFHINGLSIVNAMGETAEGFTLKYTDQFIVSTRKAQKPFSSLKYKKTLKEDIDYEISLTAVEAYTKEGKALHNSVIGTGSSGAVIPAGYSGKFELTVTGKGNYTGQLKKAIYAADKGHMIKNATITIGKNQKSVKFTGKEIQLTPARYDTTEKKYYNKNNQVVHKDNVFVVKCGKTYLEEGRDYQVSYQNNIAVGKASITITGMGDYFGTKSSVFSITGKKFHANTIDVDGLVDLGYTGRERRQANLTLHGESEDLKYPRDYSIRYVNNVNVGTATIIFTANPMSGYTGSFKKKFKIKEAVLSTETVQILSNGLYLIDENQLLKGIPYKIGGAEPSNAVYLRRTDYTKGYNLREGIDYTVSYKNNKNLTTAEKYASMVFKGIGNYTGSLWMYFEIVESDIGNQPNLAVTVTPTAFKAKMAEQYTYLPKIKIVDTDTTLRLQKEYDVAYFNNTQEEIKKYYADLENGTITDETYKNRPYAVITARENSGYIGSLTVDLSIYKKKLTAKTLYVALSEDKSNVTYNGKQVTPKITLYYGKYKAVKKARVGNAGKPEMDEKLLTAPEEQGGYGLIKLEQRENGVNDYSFYYGENITAGVDKGTVYITGQGLYGGSVTQRFTIFGADI